MTEAEFQAQVIELAEILGWRVYHVAKVKGQLRSRTGPGYPDLTLCRAPRLMVIECKTDMGKTTPDQDDWLDALNGVQNAAPETVHVAIWRPCMWTEIERALAR